MAKPTKEQQNKLQRKLKVIQKRVGLAGGAKRPIVHGISGKSFHDILDRASQPIKPEFDREQS